MCKRIVCILLVLLSFLLLCSCASGESTTVQVFSEGKQSRNGLPQFFSNLTQNVREVSNSMFDRITNLISNKVFSSPGVKRSRVLSAAEQSDARMQQIVAAINTKDNSAMKQLFSAKVQESDTLDLEISELFELFPTEILSWDNNRGSTSYKNDYGKMSFKYSFTFYVYTENVEYKLFVYDYVANTISPENEGLYMLEISPLDYQGKWDTWQDRLHAGISIVK